MTESEDSCSPTPAEPQGLGLSLRLGLGIGHADHNYDHRQRFLCPRILTAKDLNSSLSSSSSSSSSLSFSSSSCTISRSSTNNVNAISGTKRTADSVNASSQVVGWPPIRSYRMNSLTHVKAPKNEDFSAAVKKTEGNVTSEKTNISRNDIDGTCKQKIYSRGSLYVKVNMDGDPIGRKVDLNAHKCYKALAQTLQSMFHVPTANVNAIRSSGMEQGATSAVTRPSELLDGSSGYVITYEDKDRDWMLVGDVPWEMFLNSVRRLRIMRTSEANGFDV